MPVSAGLVVGCRLTINNTTIDLGFAVLFDEHSWKIENRALLILLNPLYPPPTAGVFCRNVIDLTGIRHQGLGADGNGAGDNKVAGSRDGAQGAHTPIPHTPSSSRSVRSTSSTRQPSPSSGGHFFPARKRGTASNWSGRPQGMTEDVDQASTTSSPASIRLAVGNSPVPNRQLYHPQHQQRQPAQQQEQQMRMKPAPITTHVVPPSPQPQPLHHLQQQQQQQPENTPVGVQEPSSQIEASPATENVFATGTAATDTPARRPSYSMPLPSPSSSPPPAPFTPSRQPQTPQQQPQPANFFELAASVIGVRPINNSPSAGGGETAGPGAAGSVNDQPSTPGTNNNNSGKFNGPNAGGGGSAKRVFGPGVGFAGGFAGGLAGEKQLRAGRWGFGGGGGSGGRDSGGVRQAGGIWRTRFLLLDNAIMTSLCQDRSTYMFPARNIFACVMLRPSCSMVWLSGLEWR